MSPNKRLVNLNLQKFQFSLNSNQTWNNDKCLCECKNPTEHRVGEKKNWNPATCSCENGKYVASITDNSVITCDHIINDKISSKTKTFTTLPLHH